MGFALIASERLAAHEVDNHQDIGTKARAHYLAYVAANPDSAVGAQAITHQAYWDRLYWALEHEDDAPLWLNHFWDPDTEESFGPASAMERANSLWGEMLTQYQNGLYLEAYENLGRVMHLLSDMRVPAHVHNDPHPLGDRDYYEFTYVRNTALDANGIDTQQTTLPGLFRLLAEVADDFDSG